MPENFKILISTFKKLNDFSKSYVDVEKKSYVEKHHPFRED